MKNYIQQIIEVFGHYNFPAETQKKVQRWLANEEHSEEKSQALSELWEEAKKQPTPQGMSQSMQRMQRNIGIPLVMNPRNYKLLLWKIAAALLLAVSSVSTYLLLEQNRAQENLIEAYMPIAEMGQITLPDGTRVLLNSKSTLLY